MRKGYWYLSGFEQYGLKYRILAAVAKLLYFLRLIGDEDCKKFANTLVNTWLLEQAKKHNLRTMKIK